MAATPAAEVQTHPAIPAPPLQAVVAYPPMGMAQRAMVRVVEWSRYWEGQALRLHGFRSRMLTTTFGPVHAYEAGHRHAGPTWVFMHGFGSRAVEWAPLLRQWRRHCGRVVVLDLPGHGRSPIPSGGMTPHVMVQAGEAGLRAALDADERCVLVGNSMGGLGAIRMHQKLGEQIRGLVLMSPAGAPMADHELHALMDLFALKSYRKAAQFVDRLFVNGVSPRHFTVLGALAHLNRPHLRALLQAYDTYPSFTREELQHLPPTLLIWGQDDRILPRTARAFFVRSLPRHRTHVAEPEDFGHSPYMGRSKQVAELMLAWAHTQSDLICGPALRPPSGLYAAVRAE